MSDFSKKILENNADSPALKTLQSDIGVLNETLKEATEKNYDKSHVNNLKETLTNSTILNYEKNRAEELEKLNDEITKLENGYEKKMIYSDEAIKRQGVIDKRYSALSDSEIEERHNDYINMKISDPAEIEALSRQLRERKSKSFEQFRRAVKDRGDDKPVRKLNPTLYEHRENLQNLEYGETLLYMRGKSQFGKDVKIPQRHKIKDLI